MATEAESTIKTLTSELTYARAELRDTQLRAACAEYKMDHGQVSDMLLRAAQKQTGWDPVIHPTVAEWLRSMQPIAPHLFPGNKAQESPALRFRGRMSVQEKAAAISELGMADYLALPWDETASKGPARDAQGRFRSGLRRSHMSSQDKAAYIGAHGQEAYLHLPA